MDVVGKNLRNGNTRSCGCLHDELCRQRATKHRGCGTGAHSSWAAAKTRCFNPNVASYRDYGARGITMCDEWRHDFAAFLRDMGPRPDGYTLDRIDVNRGYEPGNCRWVPKADQARNMRTNRRLTHNGVTLTVAEWGRRLGFNEGAIKQRLRKGWTVERALTTPLRVY